ncbi:MAG: hypothetical protein ACOWYE_10305, partial [Desulfatiglandales bacterium]
GYSRPIGMFVKPYSSKTICDYLRPGYYLPRASFQVMAQETGHNPAIWANMTLQACAVIRFDESFGMIYILCLSVQDRTSFERR